MEVVIIENSIKTQVLLNTEERVYNILVVFFSMRRRLTKIFLVCQILSLRYNEDRLFKHVYINMLIEIFVQ